MEHLIKPFLPEHAHVQWSGATATFEVPLDGIVAYAQTLAHTHGLPLKMITATDERATGGGFRVWYVFGVPQAHAFLVPFIRLTDTTDFPSVTPVLHQAGIEERRIQTFFGLNPVGHPDPRPIVLHENWPTDVFPLRKNFDGHTRPRAAHGEYAFQRVEGEGIYEIPVGPIHAGIIEPGHFRFSVAGEEIVLLEARLGYVHKGIEKLFEGSPLEEQVRLSERVSGDSSFSHALAFCQAVETLARLEVPARAQMLRTIFAELERLDNHFGDLGAMMIDTGFNFGGAQGARLREMMVQVNERLTGSRFLRGVNTVGGVRKDLDAAQAARVATDLAAIHADFEEVIAIVQESTSLTNRLKGTGVLTPEVARDGGVVGVAGKAVGIQKDARWDYPYAAYGQLPLSQIEMEQDGDALARFWVRIKEARASFAIIQEALKHLPESPLVHPPKQGGLKKDAVVVSIVEGWRGEIVYVLQTDGEGAITRVAPHDPSFTNWAVLGTTGVGNVVPDFPLINKSFNLSYSGNDL